QRQRLTGQINGAVNIMRHGGTAKDGSDIPAIDATHAYQELVKEGYFSSPQLMKIAVDSLRAAYGDMETLIAMNTPASPPRPAGLRAAEGLPPVGPVGQPLGWRGQPLLPERPLVQRSVLRHGRQLEEEEEGPRPARADRARGRPRHRLGVRGQPRQGRGLGG